MVFFNAVIHRRDLEEEDRKCQATATAAASSELEDGDRTLQPATYVSMILPL